MSERRRRIERRDSLAFAILYGVATVCAMSCCDWLAVMPSLVLTCIYGARYAEIGPKNRARQTGLARPRQSRSSLSSASRVS